MGEFVGNVNDNLCVTAARGRLFVPNGPVMKMKELSKKAKILLGIGICVFVVAVLALILWLSVDRYQIPHYEELSAMIGQAQADVTDVPTEAKYAGTQFTVELLSNKNLVSGFLYSYKADPESAARSAVTVSEYLLREMGDPSADASISLSKLSEETLAKQLSVIDDYSVTYTWNLTEEAPATVRDYLETLEAAEDWVGKTAGYLIKPACFYLDLIISADPDTGNACIEMVFETCVER